VTTTLVLGGARSGKSRYAEQLLRDREGVVYVAPGPVPDTDDLEWADRVAAHRARRPGGWRTVETDDLAGVLRAATGPVLIDCLATWLTSVVDAVGAWDDRERASATLAARTRELLDAWSRATVDVVAVTNEVGMAVVPATASGRLFRDELGRLNAAVSAASDRLVLVVAGRVLDLSGCPVVEP
jgi:adenosylcobinamide kinase / adenosylcobinamide-phosphate guanylyltransferase